MAEPWEDPFSFSGFGTPFQIEISKFPDILQAIAAVDAALINWATTVNPEVVLTVLVEIITQSADVEIQSDLIARRKDQWNTAVTMLIEALQSAYPATKEMILQSEKLASLKPYLYNDF